ncbi:MAG: efflux RND transporter periplasmic adaptor subunit [Cryomorphaceae bacterium]|nr:efflux RND transporter periplasmic adaptor subunit [Cryomorphaceae bacterium]
MNTSKFLPVILVFFTVFSCKPEAEKSSDELSIRRESLQVSIDSLSQILAKIDAEIAEKDTTASRSNITAFKIEPNAFDHYVEIYGTLEADKNAEIFPETQGNVLAIHVKEGQKVKKGQLLLELDGTVIKSNLNEVESQLKFAKTVFEKQERLWKQNIGSELQFLESQNNVQNLQSRLNTLRSQYNQTRIKAPFDGIIDEIFVKFGQLAAPQMPLLRLVNLDEVYLQADVSERHIKSIREGSKARLEFPSIFDTVWTTVHQTGRVINPANRTFRVVFRLENPNELYKPNLLANVYILDYAKDSVVTVPNRVIQQDPQGNSYVFVAKNKNDRNAQIEKRNVMPGLTYRGLTEVLDGLEPGELVVDKGSRSIKTGQKVYVTEISTVKEENENG